MTIKKSGTTYIKKEIHTILKNLLLVKLWLNCILEAIYTFNPLANSTSYDRANIVLTKQSYHVFKPTSIVCFPTILP